MSPFSISFVMMRFELARVVVHVVEARSFRTFQVDEESARIRGPARTPSGIERNVTAPSDREHRNDADDQPGTPDQTAQATVVNVRDPVLKKSLDRACATRLGCDESAGSFEASIGVSVSATSAENITDAASVKPNSRNSRPRSPGRNEMGTNTAAKRRASSR